MNSEKQKEQSIFEIVIHDQGFDDPKALVKYCLENLISTIMSRYRTLGEAAIYLPRDTLYGLKSKLGHQRTVSVETVFKLSLTAGYDGFSIRRCDVSGNRVCKDTL